MLSNAGDPDQNDLGANMAAGTSVAVRPGVSVGNLTSESIFTAGTAGASGFVGSTWNAVDQVVSQVTTLSTQ